MNTNESSAALTNIEATKLYDSYQIALRARGMDADVLLAEYLSTPPTLQEQLSQLDILKKWLDSFRPLPPVVVEELRKYYTVSLTYNSNAIEGNTLSQHETEMVLSQGITIGGKSLVEHLEVIGHRDAMAYMETLAESVDPLGEWEIKSLHSLIMSPVDGATGRTEAGSYRTLDVRAAGTGYIYPAHYRISDLMADLVTWLGSTEAQSLHPVIYAAEAHYRFVTIHPFRDGNGRTARLLMNLCLLRAGYPITVITNARRAAYIEALVYGQNHNDDVSQLAYLVAEASRESFIEYLRLLSTAGESRGRGALFYREMLELWEHK